MKAKFTSNRRPRIAVARFSIFSLLVSLCIVAAVLAASGSVALADSPFAVSGQGLPDNRAYEMVTPVSKNGLDALASTETVHAAPSGSGISFFATGALPGSLGAFLIEPTYISFRDEDGWTTHGTQPPASTSAVGAPSVKSISPDLSSVFVDAVEPALTTGATPGQYSTYRQDVATGSYQMFAPDPAGYEDFHLAGITPEDSHFIFEDESPLVPAATAEEKNLYEWSDGQISLVGVLPDGHAPAAGSRAGAHGTGFVEYTQTEHALSEDGSRVFFSDRETQNLYVRENTGTSEARTLLIAEECAFQTADANGSMVFYTKNEDLYGYDVETGQTQDLAAKGKVNGVLGTGGNGEDLYVYFAAESVLTGSAIEDQPNIYVSHYDGHTWTTSYVTTVDNGSEFDEYNWATSFNASSNGSTEAPAGGDKSSRVTPDGKTLLFTSNKHLTNYENAGYNELYLYEVKDKRTICVSCDPSGDPATVNAYLHEYGAVNGMASFGPVVDPVMPTHNLSDSGDRVFFETSQSLLPRDTNGVRDVYEWEKYGAGSCDLTVGCLFLISTGHSAVGSYFGDASASGNDVFIFTEQQLVPQDQDELQDIYDVRVGGGAPQLAPAACSGTGCQGVPPASPTFATPASLTFNGAGNFPRPAVTKTKPKTAKCAKGKKLSHGKCVKARPKLRKRSKKTKTTSDRRRAGR